MQSLFIVCFNFNTIMYHERVTILKNIKRNKYFVGYEKMHADKYLGSNYKELFEQYLFSESWTLETNAIRF